LSTLNFGGVPDAYFDWHAGNSLTGIQYKDIVQFSGHVAFVAGTSPSITLDQVAGEGGNEQTGLSLQAVIQTY
jgi:hypothetical protein